MALTTGAFLLHDIACAFGRIRPMSNVYRGTVGSGKDIGKDKPALGWELEPFVAFGSISGNVSWGEYRNENM